MKYSAFLLCTIHLKKYETLDKKCRIYKYSETDSKEEEYCMLDQDIVELYWKRDEVAIRETKTKYHSYLYKISYNVLGNIEDCEECEDDTYLKTWNSIPYNRPEVLASYVGKIIRQLSIDRYRANHRRKRQGSEYAFSIEELNECVSGHENTESMINAKLMAEAIDEFLLSLSKDNRVVFVCRYFYMDSIKEISNYTGFSEGKIKSVLHRIRKQLKVYLCKEGFEV